VEVVPQDGDDEQGADQEQRRVSGVLDGAARVGGRNRQRHEQQRRGDDDEGDEKKESAGQGTPL
jgi:hypothetical protein